MKTILTLLLAWLCLAPGTQATAQGLVPNGPLGAALIQVPEAGGSSFGTGFFVTHSNWLFLVTAKHVIFDHSPADWALKGTNLLVTVHSSPYEAGAKKLKVSVDLAAARKSGDLKAHARRDVVILRFSKVHSAPQDGLIELLPHARITEVQAGFTNRPTIPSSSARFATLFNGLNPGDDAFLIGYPVSLGLGDGAQLDPEEPLLKKCIVAGKNPPRQKLVIDGASYFGNSGGPVWKVNHSPAGNSFSVAGVVTEFIPFQEVWENRQYQLTNMHWANSGYCVAEPMDFVLELLDGEKWK
ncbi:MAG TPA: trypsin-like peptidase domain-containing protein [Verrucomicrobiae bacterium]|nr:trypsin-like peptidase domain-containing protein [Verrucomicrobiae bacterium]